MPPATPPAMYWMGTEVTRVATLIVGAPPPLAGEAVGERSCGVGAAVDGAADVGAVDKGAAVEGAPVVGEPVVEGRRVGLCVGALDGRRVGALDGAYVSP